MLIIIKLLRGSKTLSGFYLPDHKDLYAKYLKQLIGDVVNNKLRVVLDLGQNTSEGEFSGIDSVVRGVEVFEDRIHLITKFLILFHCFIYKAFAFGSQYWKSYH